MSRSNTVPVKHLARERAARINLDLKVESRTLGTNASYKLTTQDISKSGMLLVWDRAVSHMPYLENTLLELIIDPDKNHLGNPVSCLGKVVRKSSIKYDQRTVDVLGVQIVQMDNSDLENWEECLSELEMKTSFDTTTKIDGLGADLKKTQRAN